MRILPNDAHGLVAVHFRHHDIHQNDRYVRSGFEKSNRFAPGSSGQNCHPATFQDAAERKNISDIIVDHQHLLANQCLIGAVQAIEHVLFFRGKVGNDSVQEKRRFIK